MKSNFSIVIWMMVFSVLLKMLVFVNHLQFTSYERIAIFGNVFILMTGVFFGIRIYKRNNSNMTSFLQDVKSGMRIAALYAIFMTAFVYTYYSFIDSDYFAIRLEQQLVIAEENAVDLTNVRQTGEFVLSPFFQSTITLIGFLLLGSFYAAIITFLVRKFKFER